MNDPNAFGYQGSPSAAMAPGQSQPGDLKSPGQYKFSPEEMRVLQDCNRESFFQRSMPMATVLGFGTFAAVQKGYFKPNPRFGAFPKVTLAVAVGYFLGKLSYQQACAEKLMALPGSYIGQLLRDRRDGKIGGVSSPSQPTGAMFGASPSDIYSDAGPGSSLNLDTDRPVFSEDGYRPDHDSNASPHEPAPTPRPSLSYDELRRKNRGEYAETKQDPYRVEPSGARLRAPPPPPPSSPVATNKYGDAME